MSSCFCFLQDAICSCNCIPVDAVTEPNTVGDWPSTRAAWCLLVEPLNFIQMPLVPSCSHSYYQRRVHVCVSPSRHICAELDTADTDEENVSFFQRYTQNVSPGHPPPLPLAILLSFSILHNINCLWIFDVTSVMFERFSAWTFQLCYFGPYNYFLNVLKKIVLVAQCGVSCFGGLSLGKKLATYRGWHQCGK